MLKKNLDDLDETGVKGDWCFMNSDEMIAIRFGDDAFTGLTIIPISITTMPNKPHWLWNGNKELPTLSPSILVHDNPGWSIGWHGFLIDGKLVEA